jgi:hypothetical protein
MENSDIPEKKTDLTDLLSRALARIEELEKELAAQKSLNLRYMAETKRYMVERDAFQAMADSFLKSAKEE